MNTIDVWFGFCLGGSLVLIVVAVIDKINHAAWSELCDQYEAEIKRLRESPAIRGEIAAKREGRK